MRPYKDYNNDNNNKDKWDELANDLGAIQYRMMEGFTTEEIAKIEFDKVIHKMYDLGGPYREEALDFLQRHPEYAKNSNTPFE